MVYWTVIFFRPEKFAVPPMFPINRLRRGLAAAVLLSAALPASAEQLVDYIVALVNDDVVLSSEVDETYRNLERQFRARGSELPDAEALKRQILERIIVTRVQVQRATQGGLNVSDEDINLAMTDIAARNNMSLNQFARALRSEGIDYLVVRQQVRDEMLVEQLRRAEVESRIVVSAEDVELYLEQQQDNNREYRLSHILIALPDGANENLRQQRLADAGKIVRRAREGADFASLAVEHSNSPRALEGGDLGWRREGELPTLFADLVPGMAAGDVSDPIATSGGIHIVKLVEQRGGDSRAHVNEIHARHILLQANVLRDERETRRELSALRERIAEGADFAALAREHSEDPGSVNQGGDLGWKQPGSFVPDFQAMLEELEPGELSPVFRTPFGWHIAEVLGRRQVDRTVELRRNQAREAIFRRKVGEEFESWVRRLRDEAYVEYREPPQSG